MRTAAEIAQTNKWKQAALESVKEKLPLWTMLGIADTALQRLEIYGDEEGRAIALKAKADMHKVAVRYDLKELILMLEKRMEFTVDTKGTVQFIADQHAELDASEKRVALEDEFDGTKERLDNLGK